MSRDEIVLCLAFAGFFVTVLFTTMVVVIGLVSIHCHYRHRAKDLDKPLK